MKRLIKYTSLINIILFIGLNSISARECAFCSNDFENNIGIPSQIPTFISTLVTLAKIMVPIILIVTGMFRYVKAVVSGEDKVIKETNSSFIKSIIAAVTVFLVIAIVQFAMGLLGSTGNGTLQCVDCFVNNTNCFYNTCKERDTGMCTNITVEETCNNNQSCKWKDGKCVSDNSASISSGTKFCFECADDSSTHLYQAVNPGKTSKCPHGYKKTTASTEEECLKDNYACWKCNTDEKYLWTYKTPSVDYDNKSCPAGWSKDKSITSKTNCAVKKCYYCTAGTSDGKSSTRWMTEAKAKKVCKGSSYSVDETKTKDNCK